MAGYGTPCLCYLCAFHRILAIDGEVVTDHYLINDSFASYYRSLYSTRVMHVEGDLLAYLVPVDLP